MNYHTEHHMYPLVPYHALRELHRAVKDDCPPPYPSLFSAWREIIPTVLRQVKDPAYHIKRTLPVPKVRSSQLVVLPRVEPGAERAIKDGWLNAGGASSLKCSDLRRVDSVKNTYVVCRDHAGALFAMDGICTHGNVHLAEGLVKDGILECPKHNGRYNLADGSPARTPICRALATYPVEQREGLLYIDTATPGGAGARTQQAYSLRVVSNQNVATFIKELVLQPVDPGRPVSFIPGDYLQVDIPAYDTLRFADFDIPEPFAAVWRNQHLFDLVAHNTASGRRNNYSIAYNRTGDLHFNVRIATPPPGQDCLPGIGSSYVFSLKPGDIVTCMGAFGDFHIKPTQREMIYIGGGAGMAPLRAHLAHLLENEKTARRISFWYGARSRQEIFYDQYLAQLAASSSNFTFHPALSAPMPEDNWKGDVGFIHDVVRDRYLGRHHQPSAAEYYLCGPPMMIKACTRMLTDFGVPQRQISFDEF